MEQQSDLGGFETYDLAANVAQFPLPILVGIGHERDETILDLIAFKHFKTPTAVAAYLIDLQQQELALLADFSTALKRYATQALSWKKEELTRFKSKGIGLHDELFHTRTSSFIQSTKPFAYSDQ